MTDSSTPQTTRRRMLLGLGCTALASPALAESRGRKKRAGPRTRIALSRDAVHVIEGGQEHVLRDTVFDVTTDYDGNKTGMDIGEGARIDVLRIRLQPGVVDVDRFIRVGKGVRIGLIDVAAADQTRISDDKQDGFLQIRADDVEIGEVRFRNIDRCAQIYRASGVRIGLFECESYSRGLKISLSSDVHVGRLHTYTASPYATPSPGYNGLTISDSTRLDLPSIEIEDAAEHAIYLAGGGGDAHSQDIRFGKVITRRSGQCGFKCKAKKMLSRNISIDRLVVIDAAWGSKNGPNEDALRVENAQGFRVGFLEARCREVKRSAWAGVYLSGVSDFTLEGGRIECPAGPMVLIEDRRNANARILISGLEGFDLGAHGYHVSLAEGLPLSGLVVAGGRIEHVAGDAVRVEGAAGTAVAASIIRIEAGDVSGALVENRLGSPGLAIDVTQV